MKPTEEQYAAYQSLFDYLNEQLFDNQLPACMLTFTANGKRSDGYFSGQSWVKEGEAVHEISLNSEYVKKHSLKETMVLLAHQMVHLWQKEKGRPAKQGYHNREWASRMKAIGLIPSRTGKEGGKETGRQMRQYVKAGGRFEAAYEAMTEAREIPFQARNEKEGWGMGAGEREKYTCPECGVKIWSRGGLQALCGRCGVVFEGEQGNVSSGIEKRVYELLKVKYGG